jgi:hypothetical protein
METVAQKFPICFHDVSRVSPYVSMAEKRIEGIGRGQLFKMASRFLLFSPSFPDYRPGFPSAFRGPCRRAENVCSVHFEAQPDYDGTKPKIPIMFPRCIHGKEKD